MNNEKPMIKTKKLFPYDRALQIIAFQDLKAMLYQRIRDLIACGHLPHRANQEYKSNAEHYTNCLQHACFNFTNEEIDDLLHNIIRDTHNDLIDYCRSPEDEEKLAGFALSTMFRRFIENESEPSEIIEGKFLYFIRNTGLEVDKINLYRPRPILKNNQWLVAMYFSNYPERDFHFLRQEQDSSWTGKCGTTAYQQSFEDAPEVFATDDLLYEKFGEYVITNPYVRA